MADRLPAVIGLLYSFCGWKNQFHCHVWKSAAALGRTGVPGSSDLSVEMQKMQKCTVSVYCVCIGGDSVAVYSQNGIYLSVFCRNSPSCTDGDKFSESFAKKKMDDDRNGMSVDCAVHFVFPCFIRECCGFRVCEYDSGVASDVEICTGLRKCL